MAARSCLPTPLLEAVTHLIGHQMIGSGYIPPTVAGAATDWLPDHRRSRQSLRYSLLIRLRGTTDIKAGRNMRQIS